MEEHRRREVNPYMVTDNVGKSHRTALVIDGDSLSSEVYAERAGRLLQSLNGSNIKTDVFVARNGEIVRLADPKSLVIPEAAPFDASEAIAEVSALGYDQVLVSQPGA